jgi:hypothetical protein
MRRDGVTLPQAGPAYAPLAVDGKFRFSCTGKAVWLLHEGRPPPPGGKVPLPYCEGLEVRHRCGVELQDTRCEACE